MTTTTTLPRTSTSLADSLIACRAELTAANRVAMVAAGAARRAQQLAAGETDPDRLALAELRGIIAAAPLRTITSAMAEISRTDCNPGRAAA